MKRRLPISLLIICGVSLMAMIVIGTAIVINKGRDRALADSERELKNTALVLSEQTDRSFQSLELVLTSVIERMQTLGIASTEAFEREMSGEAVQRMLKDKISGLPHIDAVTLIGADGRVINFSRFWPPPDINIADRMHFRAFKSDPHLTSVISDPVRNRATGTWTVFVARKFTAPNGDFLGLVHGAIELEYFEKFFASIVLGKQSSISLYRRDGVLLARQPRNEPSIGKSFPSAVSALGEATSGTIRYTGRMERKDRLLAAHRLTHYPLFISVAIDIDAALAEWQKDAAFISGAAALAAIVIGIVFLLIVKLLLQGHEWSKQRLALEKLRLNTAVNNMTQGLLLFDSFGRIAVCNRRYIEMHGLSPDVVKPGCHFRELIQHRKDVGCFSGDVDQYCSAIVSSLGQGKSFETLVETADGRSIQIVNQPVAGGGWVSTHEDVTERERLLQAQRKVESQVREQKLHLDAALNNMMQGLCMFDADGRIVLCNPRYMEMMGLSADELIGVSLLDLCKRRKATGQFIGDPDQFFADILASMRAARPSTKIVESAGGRALRAVDRPMAGGGWVATFEDITEQRKIERERDRDRDFLNQIVNNVPAMIVVKNASDQRYVLINKTGEEYFGVSHDKIIGKTVHEIWPKAMADVISGHDEKLLRSDNSVVYDEYPLDTPGKGSCFVASKKLVIHDDKGEPQYLLGVIEDITERKRSDERIAHLAHYDALTDLPNRVLFREQLEQSLKWVARGERLAVLYLDLDHFKAINDTLGHPVGDELLKAVAARLRACIRDTDIVSRLGGDEFAIIQTAITDPREIIELVARIHEALRKPFEAGGHQLVADTSVGIALAPDDGDDPDLLLKNADLAMYGAKADGRGTYRFFEPEMDARVKARRVLEFDLRQAVMCGEFELYYQPLVSLRENKITGCEALLRWRHAERGMVSPSEFIPVAEETGLIVAMGEWALRRACAEASTWPDDIKVAVNVSPVQFKSGNLVPTIINALATSRLPAWRLELEITEAVLIRDDEATLAILHQLRQLGVRIAMDDFGTGYSSLSYLQRFPFDKIKIDRSFVDGLEDKDGSRSIVQAVVDIAKSRNMTTTAEGVETERQLDVLRSLGCTEMQGYLFSPAIPAAQLSRLLLQYPKKAQATG